jgi:predicted nucleic acid-binding protein
MIFIDSGFFLAFLDPRDSLHVRARAWADQIKEEMVVSEYVIWETMNFCDKPINRPRVLALVNHIRRCFFGPCGI